MARKRMIDPELWCDPDVMKLSDKALILLFGLITFADDEGIIELFPDALHHKLARKNFTIAEIPELLQELDNGGILLRYGGYGLLRNWFKHQYIRHPSPSRHKRPTRSTIGYESEYLTGWYKHFKDRFDEYPYGNGE